MGKVTGFMEFDQIEETHLEPEERIRNYREFTITLADGQVRQQGARCMDCGIPFCNNACPLGNLVPDFNDQVYRGMDEEALEKIHATNNFPEFTGRVCPALCEPACSLGLTAAQQLVRAGHGVTVFEKNDRVSGLLRYGIPDFKLEKRIIDRRLEQMKAEGVIFRTEVLVGKAVSSPIQNMATEMVDPEVLKQGYSGMRYGTATETGCTGSGSSGGLLCDGISVCTEQKGCGRKNVQPIGCTRKACRYYRRGRYRFRLCWCRQPAGSGVHIAVGS